MKLKNKFNRDGYIKIDTKIGYSQRFSFLSNKFDLLLKSELEKKNVKNLGGFIMGNLSLQQGYLGDLLFKLLFTPDFISKIEEVIENKLSNYDIFFGGNICLPNKGNQIFHTDGSYKKEMYLITVATQDITSENGATEICVGSNLKRINFWEFYFSQKKIIKLLMKKGDIFIRKHSLWHRGTKNNTKFPRLLITFALTPKKNFTQKLINTKKFVILPNFFKNNLKERIFEIFYTYLPILVVTNKLLKQKINSLIR